MVRFLGVKRCVAGKVLVNSYYEPDFRPRFWVQILGVVSRLRAGGFSTSSVVRGLQRSAAILGPDSVSLCWLRAGVI